MFNYYSENELNCLGFKSLGDNIYLSKKASIFRPEMIELGDNVRIDDFCVLSGKISIGNHIHIATHTSLFGGEKGIYIGDFSNISSRVAIYALSDDYSGYTMTNPMIPNEYKNIEHASVIIDRHVIVGSGSTVLPGAKLKEGSAFGAMTLINKVSEPWSINVGIPFKKIKNRHKNLLQLEKKFMEENISE